MLCLNIVEKTRVCLDYSEVYNSRPAFAAFNFSPEVNQESIKATPFKRYLEFFPSLAHPFLINYSNYQTISRLDSLAGRANELGDISPFPIGEYVKIIDEMDELIKGKPSTLEERFKESQMPKAR